MLVLGRIGKAGEHLALSFGPGTDEECMKIGLLVYQVVEHHLTQDSILAEALRRLKRLESRLCRSH
jgi:hypothetical protein